MFLNFLNKVKKANILEEVVSYINGHQYDEALILTLGEMKKEDRVRYVAAFLTKSHWRIFSSALQAFNEAISTYLKDKNSKALENYLIKIGNEARGPGMSSHNHVFHQVRAYVINDLLHDDPSKSAESVIQTCRVERYIDPHNNALDTALEDYEKEEREKQQKYASIVIDAVTTVWPQKSMLKVLYG